MTLVWCYSRALTNHTIVLCNALCTLHDQSVSHVFGGTDEKVVSRQYVSAPLRLRSKGEEEKGRFRGVEGKRVAYAR